MSTFIHFRRLLSLRNLYIPHRTMNSASSLTMEYEKDPAPLFIDAETQNLLQSITQLHLKKVFRKITVSENTPEYKFMTTEELEKEFLNTINTAKKRLQMPPVVQVQQDSENRVISKDPALTGFSDTKYVFTDISYGLKQSERKVVVRQTDGTLEYATLDISKRMNQLYFPLVGRKLHVPRMFEDEHLQRCLDEHKYEFVLDRLTIQFEPYEQDYHRISSRVYQHINESKEFDLLRSTRHFGPMAFFYAWHKCIDELLCDMIRRDYLRNAVELIGLQYKIHNIKSADYKQLLQQIDQILPEQNESALLELRQSIKQKGGNVENDIASEIHTAIGKTHQNFAADNLCLVFIEAFIKEHATKKVNLELAVQTYKELNEEKQQLLEGLTKAHGLKQAA